MSEKPTRHDGSSVPRPARPAGAPAQPPAQPPAPAPAASHTPAHAASQPPSPTRAPTPSPPKKERPAAPVARDASADAPEQPGALSGMHIVDDDDAVIIPDLDVERLAAAPRYATPQPRPRDANRSLFFRQTMIPILLTCGLMLPALAGLWFLTDPDHVVRGTGLWLPVTFIILGAVFLLLAVVNMAQVRHMMGKDPMPKSQ